MPSEGITRPFVQIYKESKGEKTFKLFLILLFMYVSYGKIVLYNFIL